MRLIFYKSITIVLQLIYFIIEFFYIFKQICFGRMIAAAVCINCQKS